MSIKFHGKNVVRDGIDGIDGDSTIGTVIAYMGTTAPKGYLACDGATYNISDYPDLANHFYTQFGSVSYFGGDGTSTFKVPDLRNLFLRGYHGTAEPLSGNVGIFQQGTRYKEIGSSGSNNEKISIWTSSNPEEVNRSTYIDKEGPVGATGVYTANTTKYNSGIPYLWYEGRPSNVAVLYCIRAQKDNPNDNPSVRPDLYSGEEVAIGIGMSGETIYRKCFYRGGKTYNNTHTEIDSFVANIPGLNKIISLTGILYINGDNEVQCTIPTTIAWGDGGIFQFQMWYESFDNKIVIYGNDTNISSNTCDILVIAEYSKVQP